MYDLMDSFLIEFFFYIDCVDLFILFCMEDTYTSEELTKAIAERETYLATIKQRRDEYLATKNNSGTKTTTISNGNAGFNF